MASSYPSGLDSFSTSHVSGQAIEAATDNDQADAINKIEAELGTVPKGAYATVKARLDAVEVHAFNDGTPSVTGTLTVAMTGYRAGVVGGLLSGNLIVDVTGTLQWGSSIEFRFQQASVGGPFTVTFQRNGVSTSPTVRWADSGAVGAMDVTAGAIERFVGLASPSGNLEMTQAPGPYA